ncbi:S8 family serine peptidase [Oharaeibacter diazotrophicus]|uniref:Subtilase family protein n=2 Tax=Oharaeibacter diazotrophicus TaxID=1920512 RepID=A0A4V3CW78_9HYPH|nr:S8 family serine peptidase [Oharaeibacter diazotrophicus]TDP85308.1 subtilase family protein [Oharaeibacter diazotrophicus]BBE74279.1 subtilisin BL [Pleomorphomonas sp. SM30]GLS76031.1 peptidase S8 [Oharaeibacter diazotrophicus]
MKGLLFRGAAAAALLLAPTVPLAGGISVASVVLAATASPAAAREHGDHDDHGNRGGGEHDHPGDGDESVDDDPEDGDDHGGGSYETPDGRHGGVRDFAGDDGSDRDDDDDTSGRGEPPAKAAPEPQTIATVPRSVRRPGEPAYAPEEMVASGLTAADVKALEARGFAVIGRTGARLDATVWRLKLPKGKSLVDGYGEILSVSARALAATNDYYYTEAGDCTGEGCVAPTLVRWSPSATAACGAPPTIGLVDTGVDTGHPALRGARLEASAGRGDATEPSTTDHGTAVAALLVGRPDSPTPGLLPGARLVAVDAFYRDGGTADRTDVATLVGALERVVGAGASVVNLSLSGPPNPMLERAVEAAVARGVVVVAAAGNGGATAPPSYPAAYAGVVAVTAVDGRLAAYRRANHGDYIDLAAPGVDVWTAAAGGSAAKRTGTSFAAPFVTAAAALARSGGRGGSPAGVEAVLEASAHDLGPAGRDPVFGAGLLDAERLCGGGRSAAATPADAIVPASGD